MNGPNNKAAIRVALVLLAAGVAVVAGAPAQAADKAKGAKLAEQWCNSCHTVTKADPSRKFDAGPQFVELAKKSPSYLRVAIDKPHDFMPKFPKLTRTDKADLVAYIQSLK